MSETGDGSKSDSQSPAAGADDPQKPTPSPQVSAASRRFQQTQAQVDEVVGIMRTNVEKVLERDSKLSELVSHEKNSGMKRRNGKGRPSPTHVSHPNLVWS
jgi:hypothetical protein